MTAVARHIVVRGRVQGVNYRGWVRSRAEARDVAGWAANCDDGSVEVWLQGDPEAVAAVEAQVASGPDHARVDALTGEDVAARDDLTGFERR